MLTHRAPVLNGLRDISMEDWWEDPLIVAATLERKLAGLPVDRKTNPTLEIQIAQALRLLRAIATRSYGPISLLAVLDLLLAVDYFLILRDERSDTEDHGYDDDDERLSKVFKKHANELEKFQLWFNRQHP